MTGLEYRGQWFEEPEVQFMNNDTAARGDLMIERVEVVKGGTGGILYSNGLGATINHVSRTGSQQFEGAYKLELADYMERVCDQFGVEQQYHSLHSVVLQPGDHMHGHSFPGLPESRAPRQSLPAT